MQDIKERDELVERMKQRDKDKTKKPTEKGDKKVITTHYEFI